MKDVVRVATVGAGGLSTSKIYPCFNSLPVELAAVCDLDEEKAKDRARRFGGETVYTDVDEMLEKEDLDALIACIGPGEHVAMAKKGLEAGLPVYTEKPPSDTAAGALEVARLAQDKGLLVMNAFKKRYTPIYEAMKDAMQGDGYTPPSMLSVRRSAGPYRNPPGDVRHEFLLDFCIHAIDLTMWLMGPVKEVFAQSTDPNSYAVSTLFESGAVGSLAFAAHSAWGIPDEQVTVYSNGTGSIESRDMRQLFVADAESIREIYRIDFSTAGAKGLTVGGFWGEMAAFIEAVRTGDRSGVKSDIAESYRSMVFYEAIKESAKTRKPVELHYEI